MAEETLHLDGRVIEVSHPDKVLFPEDGITKRELVDYYARIAETMLPYLAERPIMMHRFPDGIAKEGFYHKEAPDYYPPWIRRVTVEKEDGAITHVLCSDAATLAYLANQACITIHAWLSRADRPRHPDQMVFDLDPSGNDFGHVRLGAQLLRELLEELGLVPLLKTTGSRGLHVLVALDRSADFETVRAFAADTARVLAHRHPERFTTEQRKTQRRGRVYVDVLRNAYAQTAVAPYAVRPRRGAPVATPLLWEELEDRTLGPQSYTMRNIFRRLEERGDVWAGSLGPATGLDRPRQRLDSLLSGLNDRKRSPGKRTSRAG